MGRIDRMKDYYHTPLLLLQFLYRVAVSSLVITYLSVPAAVLRIKLHLQFLKALSATHSRFTFLRQPCAVVFPNSSDC